MAETIRASLPPVPGHRHLGLGTGDLWGGVAAAAVVLPQVMAFGVAVLAPAGIGAGEAALFGLLGAVALSLVAGLVGRTNGLISAPTGPVMVLLAGTVSVLLAAGLDGAGVLTALAALTAMAGLLQVAIAAVGGGTLVKYIPYPVVAGFLCGSALLMLKSQLVPLSGAGAPPDWGAWRWLPAAAALASLVLARVLPRYLPAIPGVIGGLAGGTLVFQLLALAGPGDVPSAWLIGALPGLDQVRFGVSVEALQALPWQLLLPAAVALALLGSVNTLLVAVACDVATESRHNSARELAAQGLGLLATGFAGGMAGSGTTSASLIALRSGAGRRSALVCALSLAALVAVGGGIGAWLPIGALAGIIVAVALPMFELALLRWLRNPQTRLDGVITLVVTGITVAYDLVAAIAAGVAIAIVLFLRAQIRAPVVHRRSTAANMHSVRRRSRQRRDALDAHGERIVVHELRGSLFFATADRLYEQLMPDLQRSAWVILHLRRVSQVDLTGVKILQQMAVQLTRYGGELIFCNVGEGTGLGRDVGLTLSGLAPGVRLRVRTFNGLDEALEYAENALLAELDLAEDPADEQLPLAECEICQDMDSAEVAALDAVLRHAPLAAGQRLFAAGDPGDQLYVVQRGQVEIRLPTGDRHKRLALCGPGSLFGELAFLTPGLRAADAWALQACELRILDRAGFDRLWHSHPHAALALLLALGTTQVTHQRWSAGELRRLAEL